MLRKITELWMRAYSMQVGFLARARGVDIVSTNFVRLNVKRLTDITKELGIRSN